MRESPLVDPFADDGIIYISQRHEASGQWNIGAAQPVRVAASIPFFMVRLGHLPRIMQKIKVFRMSHAVERLGEGSGTNKRMRFHDDEFVFGQRARLEKDVVGNADLADIM